MKKLSTGQDSTLENYITLCQIFFGKESNQVKFLERKAAESSNGINEEVIADERQMILMLGNL